MIKVTLGSLRLIPMTYAYMYEIETGFAAFSALSPLLVQAVWKIGTVIGFKDSGDLCVQYPNHVIWTFCLEAVVKVMEPSP